MENRSKVSPNLRHHHRIPVTLETVLETRSGERVNCAVENLSRAGFMIRCCPETVQKLLPSGEPVSPHQAVPVKLQITLNDNLVSADGDIIYVRRTSRECFNVGVSFLRFDGDGASHLDGFVLKLMARP